MKEHGAGWFFVAFKKDCLQTTHMTHIAAPICSLIKSLQFQSVISFGTLHTTTITQVNVAMTPPS